MLVCLCTVYVNPVTDCRCTCPGCVCLVPSNSWVWLRLHWWTDVRYNRANSMQEIISFCVFYIKIPVCRGTSGCQLFTYSTMHNDLNPTSLCRTSASHELIKPFCSDKYQPRSERLLCWVLPPCVIVNCVLKGPSLIQLDPLKDAWTAGKIRVCVRSERTRLWRKCARVDWSLIAQTNHVKLVFTPF